MEEGKSVFKSLTGNPTGKRPLGNLDIDEKTKIEIGSNGKHWVDLAQDRDC